VTGKRWAIAIAVVVLAGVGVLVWRGRGSEAPKYRTMAVERGTIESVVSATGSLSPVEQVEVGSQVSGIVSRIHADYNSRVKKGQVLLEIEASSFRARVVQNQAAVAKADVAVKDARRVLNRAQELVKQNYVSQAEVEAAQVALEQRQAELRQANAQLQVVQVDLDNTVIRAPIDGVVIARSIDLGQTVAASLQAPKLFVIANDLAQMQVETRIDEADIGRIRPGLPVTFTVDAYPDVEFQGEVSQVRLEPIVEQGVVTYTTIIKTGNPGMRLKPGMTANVSVEIARREDVLKVPSAALRFRPPLRDGRGTAMASTQGGPQGGPRRSGRASGAVSAVADTAAPGGRERQAGMRAGERRWAGRGSGPRGMARGEGAVAPEAVSMKPGAVYVLKHGKLERTPVMTGLTDGTSFEVQSDRLNVGDLVVVGTETVSRGPNMQPPPGMGGPGFGGRGRR
jgi:HlyD family secretion protein